MDYEFKLPDIGEGVTEGEIVEWHVKPGDVVAEDQPMVEVMTDKATVTIGAPKAGVVRTLGFDVGAIAPVGRTLVVIAMEGAGASATAAGGASATAAGGASTSAPSAPSRSDSGPAATAVGDIREGLPGTGYFARNGAAVEVADGRGERNERPLATPATRKLARDLGVDLHTITPSGDGGRVTKDDVERMARVAAGPAGAHGGNGHASVQGRTTNGPGSAGGADVGGAPDVRLAGDPRLLVGESARPGATGTFTTTSPVAAQPARAKVSIGEDASLEERRPFVGIRRKIAERLQTSKNTAAHFTFVEECHADKLVALRDRMKPHAAAAGVKLTFLPFIAKAAVTALKKHPTLNSALDETTNELVYRRYVHLGIAAATDQGLMVPVVRDADRRSLLEMAREIDRVGEGARAGTLGPKELSGSTFTITSLGKQGGLFATPVLNFPEVGILGVHQLKEKPVVRDGQIVVGRVMLLSLSFDHRIVDGHVGAAFAYDLIALLEDPDRLFLEMA